MTLDLDHLRQWIGREDRTEGVIEPDLVLRFNATFNDPAPFKPGAPAPRLIHWCIGQPAVATAVLDKDGHPQRGGFLPPVPLPRRMWASGEVTFDGDLTVGETLTRRSKIKAISAKDGRMGRLVFVTINHEVFCAKRRVIRERQDIVYRGETRTAPSSDNSMAQPKPAATVPITEPLLFRYSALTFNAHRIHYDRPYATQTEGYPGLVVNGPLQATLLYRLAAETLGQPPQVFSFRGHAPLFDGADMGLHVERRSEATHLWTSQTGIGVGMEATAGSRNVVS